MPLRHPLRRPFCRLRDVAVWFAKTTVVGYWLPVRTLYASYIQHDKDAADDEEYLISRHFI